MQLTLFNLRYYFGLVGYYFGEARQLTVNGVVGYHVTFENEFILLAAVLGSAFIAYLLGSLNFAVIISKLFYRDDIRKHGSGNAGMTNMLRTYGKVPAAMTLFGDLFKAVVAVFLAMVFAGEIAAYIAMVTCILGHAFPLYYKFKGGKGVATAAAAILCLEPLVFPILLAILVVMVAITKYISAGSLAAAAFYPLLHNMMYHGNDFMLETILTDVYGESHRYHLFVFGVSIRGLIMASVFITAGLIVYFHRSNITRLINGTENKLSFKKSVE
ncbi:MAG: glycerol-3-phosphate 1-O-acyltransferase PlsY [Oscillospiraceae bacterium]|nr:glycerol-3-phosphate 1-O-acyltransferase PlsY [Oscillospiraceae bacterium]